MPKVILNGKEEIEIEERSGKLYIGNELIEPDWIQTGENTFHLISGNKSWEAIIEKVDHEKKEVRLRLNNVQFTVAVKDKYDLLLKSMGLDKKVGSQVKSIKAPMPGLVLQLMIAEGAEVKAGEPLLVLEAMKMENIIRSAGEGKIKKIGVKAGQSVEKNQLLIEME